MIEDHICNGDFVLVEKQTEVKDGDIVVALVDGSDATLKRFYREPDGSIRLTAGKLCNAADPCSACRRYRFRAAYLAVLRKFR